MTKVVLELSMSLDGFIAGPNDNPDNGLGDGGDALFKWYSSGDTDFPLAGTDMVFKISRASAEFLRPSWQNIGASVTGRRTFDIARAWGGNPPGGMDAPYFVVTHTVPQEWVKPGSGHPLPLSRMAWRARLKRRGRLPAIGMSMSWVQVLRNSASRQDCSTKSRSTWLLSFSAEAYDCSIIWAMVPLNWNPLP